MKEMDHDRLSIDAAYKMLKLMETADPKNAKGPRASQKDKDLVERAQEFVDKIKKGDVTPNKAEKDFEHFKNVYDSLPTKKTKTKAIPPEDGYNVFVADPKSIKEAQNIEITKDAKDAALFLWATTHNIKERLDLMQSWGFSLKAIGVWNTERKTGGYFEGLVEFLLLGIKGNLEPAEDYRPEVIFNVGHKEKNKSEPVYDMAEKMFPDQHYIDLYLQNGRKNWGQPDIVEVKEDSKEDDKVSSSF
jgi:N6-adenosine-specific RNA methylase IME4